MNARHRREAGYLAEIRLRSRVLQCPSRLFRYRTPIYARRGGFFSVNMAAGVIYTVGSAFWEVDRPDRGRTKLLVWFGVAEDHDSNPSRSGWARLRQAARGWWP